MKKVDSKVPGTYSVTYKVTDPLGKTAKKSVTYTVVDDAKPEITLPGDVYKSASRLTSKIVRDGAEARWHNQSYDAKKIKFEKSLVKEKEGLLVYRIDYTLKTPNGKTASAKRKIYLDSQAPVIKGAKNLDFTIENEEEVPELLKESVLKKGISVSDNLTKLSKEDIEVTVEPAKDEAYQVTYRAEDQAGNIAEESVLVKFTLKEEEEIEEPVLPEEEEESDFSINL